MTNGTMETTRRLAEHHDVFGWQGSQFQKQVNAVLVVGGNQLADRAQVKHHPRGRLQQGRQTHAPQHRIYPGEELFARQGPVLAATRMAHHLRARDVPAVTLLLAQPWAPRLGVVPKDPAHALLRRRAAVLWDHVIPECLAVSALVSDLIAPASAGGMEEYLHKLLCSVLRHCPTECLNIIENAGESTQSRKGAETQGLPLRNAKGRVSICTDRKSTR